MNAKDIIERINSVDGLAANIDTETTDATTEHIGLICIDLDSSAHEFREAVKHDAIGDIIDRELRHLGLADELEFADADEAASVAWYCVK